MNHTSNIEKVYDEHSVRLYNMSLRIVGDRFDAEEVMHDTLIQYYKTKDKDGIMELGKWLSSICIRKSIDRLRKRKKFNDFLEEYEDPVQNEPEAQDRLEQYVKDNMDSFDAELPPSGSRDRFLAMLGQEAPGVKVRKFPWKLCVVAASAAAVLVAALTGLPFSGVDAEIEESILAMSRKEAAAIMFVEERFPDERESLMNSIRAITVEAIPFTELLPDEMNADQRVKIIKEYYGRKTEALDELMTCYDMEINR